MTIASLAALKAALTGGRRSYLDTSTAGNVSPGYTWNMTIGGIAAGVFPTTTTPVACDDTTTGQLGKHGLSALISDVAQRVRIVEADVIVLAGGGAIMLLDRLYHFSGVTLTATGTTTITAPALDTLTGNADGVRCPLDGVGNMILIEKNANAASGTLLIAVNYVDENDVTRTTPPVPLAYNATPGVAPILALAPGSCGVKAITGVTVVTAWTGGAATNLVFSLMRPIGFFGTTGLSYATTRWHCGPLGGYGAMPLLHKNASLTAVTWGGVVSPHLSLTLTED